MLAVPKNGKRRNEAFVAKRDAFAEGKGQEMAASVEGREMKNTAGFSDERDSSEGETTRNQVDAAFTGQKDVFQNKQARCDRMRTKKKAGCQAKEEEQASCRILDAWTVSKPDMIGSHLCIFLNGAVSVALSGGGGVYQCGGCSKLAQPFSSGERVPSSTILERSRGGP
ncbi:hypothetical protein FN846DRAFT_912831 [Sphaerosporella brunnea]|uniref:Uncharacterized protein n=1 Tax=Sphaerosporella brunnea TaxID=1250544 RepID=A0A5J5EFQ4_9PEZI|nr:hypothetical protein FN846DRAFT_912831 [Sphaerosporella brunnea]